jgi:hypothetical protein
VHSKVLFAASILLLSVTTYVVATYGQSVYFVAFHRPLGMHLTPNTSKPYVAKALPSFQVSTTVTATSLAPGRTQTITLKATPDSSLPAYVEVWIEGPLHTQVYKSPAGGSVTSFVKGQTQSFVYRYTLPYNLPTGRYDVSAILTSANNQTDYYVHTNFATFTVT